MQRCSIHEEPAKGEFKPAGEIAAGELGRGVSRSPSDASIPFNAPKPFYHDGRLVRGSSTKVTAQWNFHDAAPFSET